MDKRKVRYTATLCSDTLPPAGLLVMLYKGKKWAKTVAVVLYSLAILGGIVGLTQIEFTSIYSTPLIVMIFVYSMALYHFGKSASYAAFVDYTNNRDGTHY